MLDRLMKNRPQPAEHDPRLLAEINKLAMGQTELIKRLVRVETRLCALLERLNVQPVGRNKGAP